MAYLTLEKSKSLTKFNVILATDSNGNLGLDNNLPWTFPVDLAYFQTMTMGSGLDSSILIMGRKTWESIGRKPLKGRKCWVITSNYKELSKSNTDPHVRFFPDFYTGYITSVIYIQTASPDTEIWVIGGLQIYNQALRHWACGKIYWTHIDGIFKSDVQIDIHNLNIIWTHAKSEFDINKQDGCNYTLTFYQGYLKPQMEQQYLSTLFEIVKWGNHRQTRNAITWSLFNKTLSWDLSDGFPLLTTKKMFWKGIVEELLFFIRGSTDSNELSKNGVKIWEANTTREFLDSVGLTHYKPGMMGPMYGYQWRFFGKPYQTDSTNQTGSTNQTDSTNQTNYVDQLAKVIEEIKTDPHSRRILMTTFNPGQVSQGVLYPCHSIVIQFYVELGTLNCSMYQRSGDFFLGIPFNIGSTSLLVHIISKLTGLKAGIVNLVLGDYHIYESHIDQVFEQIKRTPKKLPQLSFPNFTTLEQVCQSSSSDYLILNYSHDPAIKAGMVA
jgi:dihydrofolate reductase/thymidylate synthase